MRYKVKSGYLINLILFAFSLTLILSTLINPFYWDNIVQISVPANWYYETNFKFFFLPDDIATGHPTFTGMYFALLWKIFGRSLTICHLGMFPFVFGLLLQLHRFIRNIKINDNLTLIIILGFIIADTTFLSQLSLITFDIIQLFFFFLCINLILSRNNKAFIFTYPVLMLISLRASIIAGGVLIFNVLYDYIRLNKKIRFKDYLKYIPGIISLLAFLILFRINKGWIIHNTVSNEWQGSGEFASFNRMIWNTFIFFWRLIDFGRIGLFVLFLIFLIKSISVRKIQDDTLKIILIIIIGQFIVLFPILVSSSIPSGHRYFLPLIIPVIILTVYWIKNYLKYPFLWLAFTFLVLASGHFWLYPREISQGWDATTIHWNYLKVSEKMHTYIAENNIDKKEIGTFFPNKRSRYLTHIENNKSDVYGGVPFENKYVLYSNAFNVTDEVTDSLFSNDSDWRLIKKFTQNRIYIGLYQKE